ncbi:hypothetical protein Cni_G11485 [Canna indica]|uniref:BHLH domain-containing protein n=1 Tax=Canna indica TaxID=4628 RepID=A0AAQ3Q882_9LILI|nr:hypothetical protein Cni_G11485 [Canna indica]
MALETVVFPQDLFGYAWAGGAWRSDLGELVEEEKMECEMSSGFDGTWDPSCSSLLPNCEGWNVNSLSPKAEVASAEAGGGRRKRRRTKSVKNKEEVESQRMTHIAVERNRRRQMNEYLAVLRSLMPPSYVQRGDQASIVAGAINYVKELEQLLQSLEVQKRLKQHADTAGIAAAFADFFSFPQYSTYSPNGGGTSTGNNNNNNSGITDVETVLCKPDEVENQAAIANIEVTMVESHANLKVLSRRRPKQLLKLVVGLQNLQLVPLHLNVTSVDQMVMYSFSLKVEDDCQYTSVDEIATAVHQMLGRIEEEANF